MLFPNETYIHADPDDTVIPVFGDELIHANEIDQTHFADLNRDLPVQDIPTEYWVMRGGKADGYSFEAEVRILAYHQASSSWAQVAVYDATAPHERFYLHDDWYHDLFG